MSLAFTALVTSLSTVPRLTSPGLHSRESHQDGHGRLGPGGPWIPATGVWHGQYKKPSLITRENAMVGPGDTVTLFCSSKIPFDKYHLSRKQEAHGHWLSGRQSHNGIFQVDLPLCFVSPTSVGSYRCYGAFNESPYEWSAPSDPLHVPVTGISESTCLTPMESSPETGAAHILRSLQNPSECKAAQYRDVLSYG
ncbi:hypothetical protein H8959_006683 [Pygathrix nigripes]